MVVCEDLTSKVFDVVREAFDNDKRVDIVDSVKFLYDSYRNKRIQYIDIEVEKESEFGKPENPENSINLISVYDSFLKRGFLFTFRIDFPKFVALHRTYRIDEIDREFDYVVFVFNSEIFMLKEFAKFLNKTAPDMITGWYFEDFDIPYIVERYKYLEIDELELLSQDGYVSSEKNKKHEVDENGKPKKDFTRHGWTNIISGTIIFDMLWGYNRLYGKHPEGNGLGQTALRHLDITKLSTDITGEEWYYGDFSYENGETTDILSGEFVNFLDYGFIDVVLPYLLEEKCSIIMAFHFIVAFTSSEWESLHHTTVMLDSACLVFKEPSMFLISKRKGEKFELEGGAVKEPRAGLHAGFMLVLDLSRQYPNFIRGSNLGIETYIPPENRHLYDEDEVIKLTNGEWFVKDKISFLSNIVTIVFKLRDIIEEIREGFDKNSDDYDIWSTIRQRIKEIINAVYGMASNPYTRQFHIPSARSITFLGRDMAEHNEYYTRKLSVYLMKKGLLLDGEWIRVKIKTSYGDTDSIMILCNVKDKYRAEKIGYYITDYLNKTYDIFCKKHSIFRQYTQIAFESIYRNMFFPRYQDTKRGTKKNYVAFLVWSDGEFLKEEKFIVKGMSGKKGNSPLISRDVQLNTLKRTCRGEKKEDILPFLRSIVDEARDCMTRQICPKCGNTVRLAKSMAFCTTCDKGIDLAHLKYDKKKLIKVGIPHNFGKDPSRYMVETASTRAAKYISNHFGIPTKDGDTIHYFYIKNVVDKYPDTDVFCYNPENPFLPKEFIIDEEKMLERLVLSKIDNIIPFLNIDWDEITQGVTKKTLDAVV